MPIYQFKCKKCGELVGVHRKIDKRGEPPKRACKACGSENEWERKQCYASSNRWRYCDQ